MRRTTVAAAISAASLVLPAAAPAAVEAAPKKKVVVTTKKYTGTAVEADRWGPLQVVVTVKTTTTTVGTKKTVTNRITGVNVPVYPDHTDRSVFINQQALPMLVQETLQAQSANIDMLTRATDTSEAYVQSLQSALQAAKLVKASSASASGSSV
jgi:uncharacterized protein with FMN-binding domain